MRRGRLPLTALRGFEAAGRAESMTAAADELCVSQAAVSRQVRELEELLGVALFDRLHRGIRLTPQGRMLLAAVSPAFDGIEAAIRQVGVRPDGPILLSVEPSFAASWLVPHLPAFHAAAPGADVLVEAEHRLVDFRHDDTTLAIRFSLTQSGWPGSQSRPLAQIRLSPYAAPCMSGLDRIKRPADLAGMPRLHEDGHELWSHWFAAAEVAAPSPDRGTVFSDAGLLQQAAVLGQGVALLDDILAADACLRGELVRLFDLSIPFGHHWLVARRFDQLPDAAWAFVRWIEGAIR